MLNVAVRKKLLPANPCLGVEFPSKLRGSSESRTTCPGPNNRELNFKRPSICKTLFGSFTETGLRIYKELLPMKRIRWTRTTRWSGFRIQRHPMESREVPLTDVALEAFRGQIRISGPGPWLFPSHQNPSTHQKTLKTVWHAVLRRAKVPYFRIYDLRSYLCDTVERRRSGG